MGEYRQAIKKGRSKMRVVYHEETVSTPNELLNRFEEAVQEGVTDAVIIGFDEGRLTFMGDTALFDDQIAQLLQVMFARYIDE